MSKIDYNRIYVNGELLDKYDFEILNEGAEDEVLRFKLDILTYEDKKNQSNNQKTTVEFYARTKDTNGDFKKQVVSAKSVYDNDKSRSKDEIGDIVSCTCKMSSNEYYSQGRLINSPKIVLEWCNREKSDRKVIPGTRWKSHVFIKDIIENSDSLEIKGLINDYMTQRSIRGYNVNLFIKDKELIKAFLDTYSVGNVAPLEGYLSEEKIEMDISNMDLEELPVKGIGSAREKIIKENERRKDIRENGKQITIKYYEITGGYDVLEDTKDTPFEESNVQEMQDKLNEYLEKSKKRDIERNGIIEEDDEEVPF